LNRSSGLLFADGLVRNHSLSSGSHFVESLLDTWGIATSGGAASAASRAC
jgi:hypothetical protein